MKKKQGKVKILRCNNEIAHKYEEDISKLSKLIKNALIWFASI